MQEGRGYLTKYGREILAYGQIGNQLTFTRLGVGTGRIENLEELFEMEKLKKEVASFSFRQRPEVNADGTATIHAVLTNDKNKEWVDITEYGIFALHPSKGEVLYAVIANNTHPDSLPPESMKWWEMKLDVIVQIGNAENLEIVIDRSMTYITYDDFWDLAGDGRTHQTVKGNWDLIKELELKVLGYANSTTEGKDATVIKVSHRDLGADEIYDGIYDRKEGGFIV